MKLAIYGAGGLGREVLELAQQINARHSRWQGFCFIDDINPERILAGQPVVQLASLSPGDYEMVIAVGEPALRDRLAHNASARGFRFATLIHPAACVSPSSVIGSGSVISYGAFVSCDSVLGQHCYLQPHCGVGHDCELGDCCVISACANMGGNCHIGARVFIGMNAAVREKVTIGEDTIVSMGAAVFSDIAAAVIAFGNPARAMRNNDEKKVFK